MGDCGLLWTRAGQREREKEVPGDCLTDAPPHQLFRRWTPLYQDPDCFTSAEVENILKYAPVTMRDQLYENWTEKDPLLVSEC